MKILVLDNYDSFTYNLVHIIRELGYGSQMEIYRNDQIGVSEAGHFDKILLSPGPGIPDEAGNMKNIITEHMYTHDFLGVCLGHQAIAECTGGILYNLDEVLHGINKKLTVVENDLLFHNVPQHFSVCRYHSWAVRPDSFGIEMMVTSVDEEGVIMSMRHKELKLRGVQFHPESVMTEYGKQMIRNWLEL